MGCVNFQFNVLTCIENNASHALPLNCVLDLHDLQHQAKIINAEVREVRDVAPNKMMMCLSFCITSEVAFDDAAPEQTTGNQVKRPRVG